SGPHFQSLPSPPQGDSISGVGTVTSASVSPIFLDQSPAGGRPETIGNCRNPTEVARISLLSISSVSQPNQSSTRSPANRRRDPREVQLARTSSHRRTKETTRAISLTPDPPPKRETLLNFRQKSEEN
ncbi:hypothetical protein Prudu_023145, partial [Prunus dulcis]